MTFDANRNLATVYGGAIGTGAGQVSSINVGFNNLTDQANPLSMTWNLLGSSGKPTITPVTTASNSTPGSASAVSATNQDGLASSQYQDVSIGSDGTVTVTFSNQQKLNVGRIALGKVTNPQGLRASGDGDCSSTLASGAVAIFRSGSAGLGTMQNGPLGGSNVDISDEFSALIIAQRALEANSKTITTFDTITQETIQMIHSSAFERQSLPFAPLRHRARLSLGGKDPMAPVLRRAPLYVYHQELQISAAGRSIHALHGFFHLRISSPHQRRSVPIRSRGHLHRSTR